MPYNPDYVDNLIDQHRAEQNAEFQQRVQVALLEAQSCFPPDFWENILYVVQNNSIRFYYRYHLVVIRIELTDNVIKYNISCRPATPNQLKTYKTQFGCDYNYSGILLENLYEETLRLLGLIKDWVAENENSDQKWW